MEQLSTEQINDFINDGFVKIENVFSAGIADECRAILWKTTQCDPENRIRGHNPLSELEFDASTMWSIPSFIPLGM